MFMSVLGAPCVCTARGSVVWRCNLKGRCLDMIGPPCSLTHEDVFLIVPPAGSCTGQNRHVPVETGRGLSPSGSEHSAVLHSREDPGQGHRTPGAGAAAHTHHTLHTTHTPHTPHSTPHTLHTLLTPLHSTPHTPHTPHSTPLHTRSSLHSTPHHTTHTPHSAPLHTTWSPWCVYPLPWSLRRVPNSLSHGVCS